MTTITLNAVQLLERPQFFWQTDTVPNVPGYHLRVHYQVGFWDATALVFTAYSAIAAEVAQVESTSTSVTIGTMYTALLNQINQAMAPSSSAALSLVTGQQVDQGAVFLSS